MLATTTMAAQFLAFVMVPYLLQALVLLSLVFITFPMTVSSPSLVCLERVPHHQAARIQMYVYTCIYILLLESKVDSPSPAPIAQSLADTPQTVQEEKQQLNKAPYACFSVRPHGIYRVS